jgi:hypothetical protein
VWRSKKPAAALEAALAAIDARPFPCFKIARPRLVIDLQALMTALYGEAKATDIIVECAKVGSLPKAVPLSPDGMRLVLMLQDSFALFQVFGCAHLRDRAARRVSE